MKDDVLKNTLAAIETDFVRYIETYERVSRAFHPSSSSTDRVRKFREKQRVLKGVANENTSATETVSPVSEHKKDSLEVVGRSKNRNIYPEPFLRFWKLFPTDEGMSKSEAFKAWQKLSSEDQQLAIDAIPAFKTWVSKQGTTYRVVHACRYLSQRRFDGFQKQIERAPEPSKRKFYVMYGTLAGDAWQAFFADNGKVAPRDGKGGWWYDSEFPPTKKDAA